MTKISGIVMIATSILGVIISAIVAADQIKNGDRRAQQAGEAAGKVISKNLTHIV